MSLTSFFQKAKLLFIRPRAACSMSVKPHTDIHQPVNYDIKGEDDEEIPDSEKGYPDELDIAVGMYKKELLAYLAGVKDPFTINPLTRGIDGDGTKINPVRVPSAFESRMICCLCEPESYTLMPLWLHQGESKRCRCGYWMVLYYKPPFVEYKWPQP